MASGAVRSAVGDAQLAPEIAGEALDDGEAEAGSILARLTNGRMPPEMSSSGNPGPSSMTCSRSWAPSRSAPMRIVPQMSPQRLDGIEHQVEHRLPHPVLGQAAAQTGLHRGPELDLRRHLIANQRRQLLDQPVHGNVRHASGTWLDCCSRPLSRRVIAVQLGDHQVDALAQLGVGESPCADSRA